MAPHVLHMTATPIPRTLSLTAYGDLDTTALHELPAGRRPVETRLVERGRSAATPSSSCARQLREGRQAFVVCPLVAESEKQQGKAAEVEAERLRRGELRELPRRRPARADALGREGRGDGAPSPRGETDVLVATTVIEVGIDVANATVMVIEGAERYGVSQLHQLRGRVGRGEHPIQCLLFAEEAGELARRRLRGGRRASATASSSPRSTSACAARARSSAPASTACRASPSPSCPRTTPLLLAAREEVLALLRAPRLARRPGARPAARRRPPPLRRRRGRPDPPLTSLCTQRRYADEGHRRRARRGSALVAPRGWKVRPTSDRVREAIFSALGDGSAAPASSTSTAAPARWRSRRSRAAPRAAVLVDRDTRPALGNVERLGLGERAELVRADAGRWLGRSRRRRSGEPLRPRLRRCPL